MKTLKTILAVCISCLLLTANCQLAFAQGTAINTTGMEVPFTLQDRDRLIQIEEKLNSQQKEIASLRETMDDKFEAMDDKLDKLYTLIYFILGGVFGLIGLIMWDRRFYIKPVKEDIAELQNALKEYSKEQPKLAEILRSHGLL